MAFGKWLFCLVVIMLVASCSLWLKETSYYLAPETVRKAAFAYAKKYEALGTIYEWGSQDPLPRQIKVDCSGLVIRCYEYASADYGYSLPFTDTNAIGLSKYCALVDHPKTGDLIFMGEDEIISHVALFDRFDDGNVYFIDSTNLTGIVSERKYPITSSKIIQYGRMYLYLNP
ncbi:MAG: NlpC/P60 family protein [Spirochaetes bacterium ADurb.Bin110]|jgi:cell wall-associated NlpC family hydrolase|nr:MAG: NlpC/P60 family protein [Spirochaetes bacterium ADurb.Bin110]